MDEGDIRHVPVLCQEVVGFLRPRPGDVLVDATVGEGGHARAILHKMEGQGCLIGLDRDGEALRRAGERLREFAPVLTLRRADFSSLREVLQELGVREVNGVLLDLGVSSLQLESPQRGFSYRFPGRLDMRMDRSQDLDAWKVVNEYEERELARIIREYGEERWAARIARGIALARKRAPIDTTDRLAEVVRDSIPAAARRRGRHPARRTFQALRMEVNGELRNLGAVLPQAAGALKEGGRLVVISYHSLEDRLVKRFFLSRGSRCACPLDAPRCTCGRGEELRILTAGPVRPGPVEVEENPRSRGAKLRAAEKR